MPRADAFRDHDHQLDQGDILSDVRFVEWDEDGLPKLGEPVRGIITSDGCACEDFDRAVKKGRTRDIAKLMLHVAPLVGVTQYPKEARDGIERGEYYDRFYVYGDGEKLGDQALNFGREQGIPARVLVNCKRTATVANWQWTRLIVHQTVSRFHQYPETLFRPELLVPVPGEPHET